MSKNKKKIKYDESVLKLINKDDNDKLSKMEPVDKIELIKRTKKYYLTLRDNLNLDQNSTFGLEIEFDKAKMNPINNYLSNHSEYDEWDLVSDITLEDGAELVSPILTDKKENWEYLRKICKKLKKNASITDDCGGHVHIGTQILGNDKSAWLNFANTYAIYEPLLFRFGYGDFLRPREDIAYWAVPKAKNWINKLDSILEKDIEVRDIIRILGHDHFDAVNLENVDSTNLTDCEYGNTIEFRSPNGTLNPVVWQNNVNTFAHLLDYSKTTEYDRELLKRARKKVKSRASNMKYYNQVDVNMALKFADKIFNNNLDKIYFLNQYFQDYDIEKDKKLVLK